MVETGLTQIFINVVVQFMLVLLFGEWWRERRR